MTHVTRIQELSRLHIAQPCSRRLIKSPTWLHPSIKYKLIYRQIIKYTTWGMTHVWVLCYFDSSCYPTVPMSDPWHTDKATTLEISNYNENLHMHIAKFKKLHICIHWYTSPNTAQLNKSQLMFHLCSNYFGFKNMYRIGSRTFGTHQIFNEARICAINRVNWTLSKPRITLLKYQKARDYIYKTQINTDKEK